MASSLAAIIPADGVLTINDGAGSPLTYQVNYEGATFKMSGIQHGNREAVAFKDKDGAVYSIRDNEYIEYDFEFEADLIGWADASDANLTDVVYKKGTWASATSLLPTARGDSWLVKVTWTVERTNLGASADNTLTMKYCRLTGDISAGTPAKIAIKGKAYVMSHDKSASVALA